MGVRTDVLWHPTAVTNIDAVDYLDLRGLAVLPHQFLQNGTAEFDYFTAVAVDQQDGSVVLAGVWNRSSIVMKVDAEGTFLWETQVNVIDLRAPPSHQVWGTILLGSKCLLRLLCS